MPLSVEMTISSATTDSRNDLTIQVRQKSRAQGRPGINALLQRDRPRGRMAHGERSFGDQGRFILQVVGTMVCAVSILDTRCQPQPVFSSSNGSLALSVRVPNEEM